MNQDPSPSALHPDRDALMRHNQKLTFEELRLEAVAAFEKSDKTQAQIASDMGKSQALISRALNDSGSSYAKMQRELIAHLTDYEVEEEVDVIFRVRRKEDPSTP